MKPCPLPLLLWLAACLVSSCSSPPTPQLDPVFVVLCADPDPSMDPHPCCTGFALGSQVVTASHCAPTDTVLLVSRHQWLTTASASEVGTVTARNEALDIAWMSAALDGPGLTQGAPVEAVEAVSALTEGGVLSGSVGERYGQFWQSTISSQFGDSGAAVVDATGRAVGVLSRCLTTDPLEPAK